MPRVHLSIVKKSKSRKDTGVGKLMGNVWRTLFGWLERRLKFDRRLAPPSALGPQGGQALGNVRNTRSPGLRRNRPQQTGHCVISVGGRERRNRRILLISVVRLSPNLAAAPFGPPITQLVSRRV